MKKFSLVVVLVCATSSWAGLHIEDFNSPEWEWTGTNWMQFSIDKPLDGKAETPNSTIRSAYDWTHGWVASNISNEQYPEENFPIMMIGGVYDPNVSYEEYYLDAGGLGVRWTQATFVSYNECTCVINVDVIGSDDTVLFSATIDPNGLDTVVHLDFGSLAYDSGGMTLRVEDGVPGQGQRLHSGYWGIDNLGWAEIPEPATIVLLGLGGLLLRKRH